MKASEGVGASSAAIFEHCRLTGLRYTPLPHESTFSALMRLAWLNAFNRRELADYCIGSGKPVPNGADFYTLKWMRSESISRSFGWKLPSEVELAISGKFSDLFWVLWSFNVLKYCPICMEGLYHSHWFQLKTLQRCPVHNCKLMVTCMSCGAPSPKYRFDSAVVNSRYLCATCGKPFCGVSPNIEAHEFFRESSGLLEEVFRDYRTWLERFERENFHMLWPEHEYHEWFKWCDVRSIQAHFIHQISKLPSEIAPIPRNDLIILRWRTRMFDEEETHPFSAIYHNGGEMRQVLRVFLRHIEPWAFSGISAADRETISNRYYEHKRLNPQDYDVKQLAYLILENTHRWPFGPRKGQLDRMSSWNNRIPRVAYCAYLYGVYSGIYHHLRRERLRGAIAWPSSSALFYMGDYLIAMCDVSWDGVYSGRIIFPEVPGMPLLLRFGRGDQLAS